MAITKASAQTTVNSGVTAAAAATINQILVAPASATSLAGGGTIGGVTISNVAITDSTFANVLSGDTAIGSSGGFVKITGTGFKTGAGVFFNNARVANTFVSSTQINANIPATTAGTYNFYVFNTDGSGTNFTSGLVTSGFPTVTVTTYNIEATGNTQITASGDAPLTFSIKSGSSNTGNFTVNAAGYIGATAVADGTYTLTVIVDDAQGQSTQQDLSVIVATSEPYFYYTTLLLNGDGTNNANNQAFIDSSSNNFTITRNGNPTQGTFSPFSQTGWSNYFDGSSDYLSITNDAAFKPGTGDFTVEFWGYLFDQQGAVTSGGSNSVNIQVRSGALELQFEGVSFSASYSLTGYFDKWNHYAYARTGGVTRMFINGTLVNSVSETNNYQGDGATFNIGQRASFAGCKGYISNLRFVKGTALYTANFTPSTTPLTAVTNTTLLTCQDNRFRDNSSNNWTMTRNGDVSVQAFSPFAPTAAYSSATVGGSAYFDGGSDYIRAGGTVGIANNQFTICFWFYPLSSSVIGLFDSGSGVVGVFRNYGTNQIQDQNDSSVSFAGAYQVAAWNWMCITKSGTSFTVYINGASVGTGTCSAAMTETSFDIGTINTGGDGSYNGYISDFHILNTATVVAVPTAPRTAVSGTTYLLNFTNAGIKDGTAKNILETSGDTKVSTAISKFGGSSMYFPGGSHIKIPNSPNLKLTSGDWTIEFWMYCSGAQAGANNAIWTQDNTGGYTGIIISANSSRQVQFTSSEAGSWTYLFQTIGTYTDNTWHHVAVTKSGSTVRGFFDGTLNLTINSFPASILSTTNESVIGLYSSSYFIGYLDDFRITKGYARYTANFTPPTSTFKLR